MKLEVAFSRAAASFDVQESDYLVLISERVTTLETMALRFPQSSGIEDYLKKVIRTKSAYCEDDGSIATYLRPNVTAWEDYRHHDDTGCP